MSARFLIAFAATTSLVAPALAKPDPAVPIRTLKDVTRTLSSDAYAGRAPTSPEEAKTIQYIAARMAKAGLKPGNILVPGGSWYQDVPMVEIDAAPSPLTFTGGKSPIALAYKSDMVIGTSRVVPKVEVENSDVVFVGYGINEHDVAVLDRDFGHDPARPDDHVAFISERDG